MSKVLSFFRDQHSSKYLPGIIALTGLVGSVMTPSLGSAAVHGGGITGRAHGGYGPLVGSTVTLYAAGTTGYGSTATALGSAVTDSSGNFSLTNYTCPAADSMTYLTAAGGKSGSVTTPNPAIRLILGTGPCATIPPTEILNELSTVATVYALARFTDPTTLQIGAPSTNTVGFVNAFVLINSLYNLSTGVAGPLYSQHGLPPAAVQKFNTLADILVSCVNSASPFAACTSLFAAAPTTGSTPTNTQEALVDIALAPASNVAQIYAQLALVSGPLPYTPALPSVPNQWFLTVFHVLGSTTQPLEVAVDASGNVYAADHGISGSNGGLIKVTPSGSYTEFTTDAAAPFGVAVTAGGGIWVTNDTNGTLVQYNSSGAVIAGPISGLVSPRTVVVDQTGNVWVANTGGNSVLEYSSTGVLINTFQSTSIKAPFDIAVDASGNLWSANEASSSISLIAGTSITSFTGNGLSLPKGIVVNNLGEVWVGNFDATTRLSEFTSTGAPVTNYTTGGTGRILRLASDGAANIWAADVDTHAATELTPGGVALSPAPGFISRSLIVAPQSIAVDPSGNVWISDLENTGVTEFIGGATPVKAPLIGPAMLP